MKKFIKITALIILAVLSIFSVACDDDISSFSLISESDRNKIVSFMATKTSPFDTDAFTFVFETVETSALHEHIEYYKVTVFKDEDDKLTLRADRVISTYFEREGTFVEESSTFSVYYEDGVQYSYTEIISVDGVTTNKQKQEVSESQMFSYFAEADNYSILDIKNSISSQELSKVLGKKDKNGKILEIAVEDFDLIFDAQTSSSVRYIVFDEFYNVENLKVTVSAIADREIRNYSSTDINAKIRIETNIQQVVRLYTDDTPLKPTDLETYEQI